MSTTASVFGGWEYWLNILFFTILVRLTVVFVCTEGQKARTSTQSSPWGSSESCGRSRPSNGCPSWRCRHLVSHFTHFCQRTKAPPEEPNSYSQECQDKIFWRLDIKKKFNLKHPKCGASRVIFLNRRHVKNKKFEPKLVLIFVIFRNTRPNFI